METLLSPFTPDQRPKEEKPKADFFDQYRYYILGTLVIVLGIGLYLVLTPPPSTLGGEADYIAGGNEPIVSEEVDGQLVVDVAGGVNQPGVYRLNHGCIVEDVIAQAGGLSSRADANEIARSINRAAIVTDHSKIYIPQVGDNQIVYTNPTPYAYAEASQSKININTADSSALDKLPGVGEVTAQRIIDYRLQNGQFGSIEDLKNVPGIGESKFNSLKDLITI